MSLPHSNTFNSSPLPDNLSNPLSGIQGKKPSKMSYQQVIMEKEMATHSSTLAWKIPWMEEPGRLQSMGSQRVGHDWVTTPYTLELGRILRWSCLSPELLKEISSVFLCWNIWRTIWNFACEMYFVIQPLLVKKLCLYLIEISVEKVPAETHL